jgi:hypothetical protein
VYQVCLSPRDSKGKLSTIPSPEIFQMEISRLTASPVMASGGRGLGIGRGKQQGNAGTGIDPKAGHTGLSSISGLLLGRAL